MSMALTVDFDELKKADESSQFAVFGYVRNMKIDSFKFNPIPPLISYICLMYFYAVDHFESIGNHTYSSTDNSTIKKTDNGWTSTSYGSIIIPSTDTSTIKWFINLIDPKGSNIIIGIQSSKTDTNHTFTWNKTGDNYYGFHLVLIICN